MNWHSVRAIFGHEMARFFRTIWQSLASPVLSTVLYFVVFGAAICGRTRRHHDATAPSDPFETNFRAGNARQDDDDGVLRGDDNLSRCPWRRSPLGTEFRLREGSHGPQRREREDPERPDGRRQEPGGSAASRKPTRLSFVVGGSHCRYVVRQVVGRALNRPPRTIIASRSPAFALYCERGYRLN